MPKKGDDLKAITVAAAKEHHFTDVATINSSTVNGMLENEYVVIQGMEGTALVFTCATADVDAVARGEPLIITAINYKVAIHEKDGTGLSRLILELQD